MNTQAMTPARDARLPELPEPQKECWIGHELFTADQMHAYALEALARQPAPSQPADAVRGLADMLDPAKQADTLRRAADALREGGRDREADRALFPDADFNDWLDCVITDCGHTVYDSIGCIADAWQGWHAHVVHLMVNDPASG